MRQRCGLALYMLFGEGEDRRPQPDADRASAWVANRRAPRGGLDHDRALNPRHSASPRD